MRASIAILIAVLPAGVLAACGGGEFQAATGGEDASSAFDGAPPAADGPGTEAAYETGAGPDAGGAADASPPDTGFDGGSPPDAGPGDSGSTDAPFVPDVAPDVVPDVIEELPPPPPHCGGEFACVPAPPSGWSGPYEFFAGNAPAPACTTNFGSAAFDGNAGLDAGVATCGCTCDTAKDVSCAPVQVDVRPSVGCTSSTTGPCDTFSLTAGQCKTIDDQGKCNATLLDISAAVPAASGGSCAPLPTSNVPPLAWSAAARACASGTAIVAADCSSGSVCAPYPSTPFQAGLCITQSGDVACPQVAYTVKHLFYGGVADTRGCSKCTCGPVTGATCSGRVDNFKTSDGSCNGSAVSYPLATICSAVQQPGDFRLAAAPSGGSCTPPDPVSPVGQATPAQPMTICCATGP